MNLKHLTDAALLKDTKNLASKERELTVQIIHHIKEIDRRKLYCDLGYTSLYEYCMKELCYSEASAQRRIIAARMIIETPSIEKKIESGELSLSNLSQAGQFFKENEIKDPKKKIEVLKKVENTSSRECGNILFELSGKEPPKKINLTILKETHEKIEELKSIINKGIDDAILISVSAFIEVYKKKKFKTNSKKTQPPTSEVKRVIPANLKRIVYLRDKKCVKCGSTHHLNYDHRKPFALGGKTTLENVRLLCFNCNQRSRIKAKL